MNTEELTKRVDTIDMRLDRLTTDIEELKDSHKLMRDNIKDVLFGIELLGDHMNKIIDVTNRQEVAIGRLVASQERTDAAIQRTNEAIDSLALKQAETAETVDRLSKTVDRYLSARLNGNN